MRTLASIVLIPLLVLCPLLCGAGAPDRGTHLHRALGGIADQADPPTRDAGDDCCPGDEGRVPQGGDHCLCKGAVQAELRADDGWAPDLSAFAQSHFLASNHSSHLLIHQRSYGTSTGRAAWGALAMCALLQIFRC